MTYRTLLDSGEIPSRFAKIDDETYVLVDNALWHRGLIWWVSTDDKIRVGAELSGIRGSDILTGLYSATHPKASVERTARVLATMILRLRGREHRTYVTESTAVPTHIPLDIWAIDDATARREAVRVFNEAYTP